MQKKKKQCRLNVYINTKYLTDDIHNAVHLFSHICRCSCFCLAHSTDLNLCLIEDFEQCSDDRNSNQVVKYITIGFYEEPDLT